LYMRTEQDFRLTSIIDRAERQKAEQAAIISIKHRIDVIGAQGIYKAVEAGVVKAGSIEAYLKVKQIDGQVIQIEAERIEGGQVRAEGHAERLDGLWIGVKAGAIEQRPEQARQAAGAAAELQSSKGMEACPHCGTPNQAEANYCSQCGGKLIKSPQFCANCGTRLQPGMNFCPNCGAKVA
jgi:hypothetical protein